jgi:hypothetical protein
MRIILDGIDKCMDYSCRDSVESIFQKINSEISKTGRIVVEIFINGEKVREISKFSVEDVKIIEINTKKPNILLIETLLELERYIDRFLYNIDLIIEALEFGQVSDAIDTLLEGINGLEWIFGVLESTEELLGMDEQELDIIFEKANDVMAELINALENKSYEDIKRELSFNLCSLLVEIKDRIPDLSHMAEDMEKNNIYSN